MEASNIEKKKLATVDLNAKIRHAYALIKAGQIEEAEARFEEIVEKFSDAIQGHAGLARAAQQLENWELALNRWEKVIEIAPDHLNARVQRANMLMKTGRIEEAKDQFHEIAVKFPDEVQGHSGLARAAQRLENWELALNRWEKVIDIAPDHLNARVQRANMLMKTGRIDQAEERFQELVTNFPEAVQGHEGLARAAQRREDWALAFDRWEKVSQIAPDNVNAKAQCANMLLNIGRIEEAEEDFQKLVSNFPNVVQGHAGLARVARINADWGSALKAAKSVFERCEPKQLLFAQMAQTTILALVRLNKNTEAKEAVKEFEKTDLSDENKFLLTATMLQEQARWMEALAWYRKHENIVLTNPHFVLRHLEIFLRCGFSTEAFKFFKRYLRTNPPLGNGHRPKFISILERIGKDKLAFRWLSLLVRNQGPGILDRDMVIILSAALLKNREYDRFHSLAERIMADGSLSVNSTRSRLTVFFFQTLANHLEEHHMIARVANSPRRPWQALRLWDQLKEQICKFSNEKRFRKTCLVLDGFGRSYGQIEEGLSKGHFLVNAFLNPWECYRLVDFLIDRIQLRQPTALVRLGEGEGNFLPYPEHYQSRQSGDRATQISHWWETRLDEIHTSRISSELIRAIGSADIIGIPEPAHLILDMLPIPTPPDLSSLSMQWRGVLSVFHYLINSFGKEEAIRLHSRLITASFINYDLELWGGYDLIMQAAGSCSVICSHPDIAAVLRDRFHVEVHQVLLIPPERKFAHRASDTSAKSHFPDFFEHLARTLTVCEKGELFLVAAGILGKSYCTWIKERGGIAIDIGSMVDFWCGARTRRNSMHARASIGQSIRKQAMYGDLRFQNLSFLDMPTSFSQLNKGKTAEKSRKRLHSRNGDYQQADPFIDPQPSPASCDSYIIRSGIKKNLYRHLPLFTGTLLDVGCGRMPYKDFILEKNPGVNQYIGLDFPSGRYANLMKPDIAWDGIRVPLADSCIDCVMATEVLEHCPEPLPVLKEIRRVLKPDGVFFFTTPFLWPLHDTPHDHYRYTPYSLERLLCEAGFEDIQIESMGGWEASLAQMIGLYLRRAPMKNDTRKQMTEKLFPLYKYLVEQDGMFDPALGSNSMCPGWSGLAYRPLQYVPEKEIEIVSEPGLPKICLVRSVSSGYSETFIDDHIAYLSNRVEVLHGRPFPMFDVNGDHVFEPRLFKTMNMVRGEENKQKLYTEALALYLKKAQFDVVFAEYGTNGAKVYKACQQAGLPCVVHFHGYDASNQSILNKFKKEYEEMFSSAAFLIVVSRVMMEKLIFLGAPKEKVIYNPCGVSVARHDVSRPEQSLPVFLSVGRFVEKKSPDLTIRSFSRIAKEITNSRLIMAGDGPLLPRCKELVQELGIQDHVLFTGVQSRRSIAKLMRISRAFVQHSITAQNGDSEGLPVAILEAGAAGLPVISTRHAGIPDAVIEKYNGFLVDEKDVKGMAEAMLILARDPKLAGRMGKNYHKRIVENFSRQKSIIGLRKIIDNSLR